MIGPLLIGVVMLLGLACLAAGAYLEWREQQAGNAERPPPDQGEGRSGAR